MTNSNDFRQGQLEHLAEQVSLVQKAWARSIERGALEGQRIEDILKLMSDPAIERAIEQGQRMEDILKLMSDPVIEPALKLRETSEKLLTHLAEQLARFQEDFFPALVQLAQSFEKLPERDRRALRVLARNGWYLDPRLPFRAAVKDRSCL
jgi:hypothetical protein